MSRSLIPNSTQIPDIILDRWMAHLSGAEFKVVMYIARRTYGFGKAGDTISLKQIVGGIRTKDGRQLDQGTGLNKDTICKVLTELEKKNIIIREQRTHEEYGDLANFYSLNLECEFAISTTNDQETTATTPVSEYPTRGGKILSPPRVGISDTGSRNIRLGGVGISDTQETAQQETVKQETAAAEIAYSEPIEHLEGKRGSAAAESDEKKERSSDSEINTLVVSLLAADLNRGDAERFALTKPTEARRQLEYLPFKTGLENPGGYLRSAIEGGFPPPKEYRAVKAKEERERKKREEATLKQEQEATQRAVEEAETFRVDSAITQLEIEAPGLFSAFSAYVESEERKVEARYFGMKESVRARILQNFRTPAKRRELFGAWNALLESQENEAMTPENTGGHTEPSDTDRAVIASLIQASLRI